MNLKIKVNVSTTRVEEIGLRECLKDIAATMRALYENYPEIDMDVEVVIVRY